MDIGQIFQILENQGAALGLVPSAKSTTQAGCVRSFAGVLVAGWWIWWIDWWILVDDWWLKGLLLVDLVDLVDYLKNLGRRKQDTPSGEEQDRYIFRYTNHGPT